MYKIFYKGPACLGHSESYKDKTGFHVYKIRTHFAGDEGGSMIGGGDENLRQDVDIDNYEDLPCDINEGWLVTRVIYSDKTTLDIELQDRPKDCQRKRGFCSTILSPVK